MYLHHSNMVFLKKRSTEITTVLFLDEIHKAIDRGNLTGVLFVDLSNAFDTVSHSSILDKLPAYRNSGNEKAWFTDYLFHRKMRVSYKGTLSTPIPIHCDILQGSVLGLLLFLCILTNYHDC